MRHQYYELSSDSLDLCKGKLTPGVTATWGEIAGNIETQKDLVSYISAHGTAAWGSISGSITDQTDLIEYTDRFATTAWIGEQDYLHKYNASGEKSMIFNTSRNSIYLRDAEQQLNITGEGIAMYSAVPYDSGVSNVVDAYLGSTGIGLAIHGYDLDIHGQNVSGRAVAGIGTTFRESDSYAATHLFVSGISGWCTYFHDDRMSVYFFSDGIGSQKRELVYTSLVVSSDLYSYATKTWVSAQSYVTESWVSSQGYLVSDDLSQYATRQWVTGRGYITTSALSGYATESWVSSQGYITSSSLSGYATESWVQEQGYITTSALSSYATQSWVESQDYLPIGQFNMAFDAAITPWTNNYLKPTVLSSYATISWVSSQNYLQESSTAIQSIEARLSALETNYGDALSITNNILS